MVAALARFFSSSEPLVRRQCRLRQQR
jgi:hypothetical protein